MRGAVYARVSTVNNGQSPEMQLRNFSDYCTRPRRDRRREYVDEGISGGQGFTASVEQADGRCTPAPFRRRSLEVSIGSHDRCPPTEALLALGTVYTPTQNRSKNPKCSKIPAN